MKSAKDWMKGFLDNRDSWSIENINAIQADVLRYAAGLCNRKSELHSNPDFAECHLDDALILTVEASKLEQVKK